MIKAVIMNASSASDQISSEEIQATDHGRYGATKPKGASHSHQKAVMQKPHNKVVTLDQAGGTSYLHQSVYQVCQDSN